MKAHMSQVSTPWDHQIIRELHTLKKPIRLNGTVEQLRSWVNPHLYSAFALFPVESWILVPLRIAGELIGTLSVFRFGKDTGYTPEDEDFLQDLADRAALALNNAQLYYRAQKAIQLREDFMSIASHELKTPLTPLKMQLQLLTTFVTSGIVSAGAQGQALLKLIEASDQQIVRLSRLVEDMLDTSRISTGKLSLNREEVDLAELAHSVVERFHSLLASAKCHVQIVSHGDAHGKWDRLRIEQIINNLLSNAIKYGAGKPITITVSSQPGRAFLEVQDQGIGINRSDLGRIFERFERAVSVDRFGGLGLGLYISNQIVKAHGGTIRVESEPGKGSRFIVELPSELAQIKRVA
jgi:signal transduction histidine kinase